MRKTAYSVGLVGATGLIGEKFLRTLEKRNFPVGELRLFASEKSAGKKLRAFGRNCVAEHLRDGCFVGLDFVFFSAGKEVSAAYAVKAEDAGAVVIDNSSAFREDPAIPLVVPEINFSAVDLRKRRIIANPNCSTIQVVIPLAVLDNHYGIERIIYTTYQAVSGSGKKGVADLRLTENGFSPTYYPLPIAKTCIAEIGGIMPDGYTEEERKMQFETNKILGASIPVSATCVRTPIENCHAVSAEVELKKKFGTEDVKRRLASADGIILKDLPSAVDSDGRYETFVGRIRKSTAFENGLAFLTYADNTLRGAAFNAVAIAEKTITENVP